ncbi:hypothetical protein BGW38_005169 [Lunasporangiospora selenospora]|uniref:Rhodanese domain-containing protein n=1 Tax=Lunasporangiospora selenospora TaxID=979761 RepID=A0A9P6FNC4_9FUNG|nr:hypothetical protein BGW38_005169 [Lunasporangiospora selenospora]
MLPISIRLQTPLRAVLVHTQQRSFAQSTLALKSFPELVREIKSTNKNIHYLGPKDLHALCSAQSTAPENPRLPPHIIDVRERAEIESQGTIPGAIPLPRGVLERDVGKLLKQSDDRDVVVYCAGGFRSVLAAESLVRLGYGDCEVESKDGPKVWSLDEGFDGWVKNGFEVEKKSAKN